MQIYQAHIIDTPSPTRFRILENGYVGVDDTGHIVGLWHQLPDDLMSKTQDKSSGVTLTCFGDKMLIPAFCDLHVHAPQYRNLGLALDEELLEWLNKYTFPEEARFADIGYAERIYRRFVHELWMQGTLHSSVFATIHPHSTTLLARLFRQAGMGAYVGLVGMDRNSPDNLRNTTEDIINYYQSLTIDSNDEVRPIITPRFIPSCTPQMLTLLGQIAQQYNLPVQSHLSENRSEIEWVKQLEPDTVCYADAYRKYGLLGTTPTLMAHCCYSEEKEMGMLRDNKVTIVHCPTSNSNLASGIAPVRTFLDNGIPVALGTDVSAGHYMSMLRVIQYAIQVSKLHYAHSDGKISYLSMSEAFYLATKSGGSFFGKTGSFDIGNTFDALLIDDSYLNYDHYSLPHRLQRYVYIGDDRDIRIRFYHNQPLTKPNINND